MTFGSILCTPLPVPPWANGLVFGAGFVWVTATGAAYYLSMRHVMLLRLFFYGGSAFLVTLAIRGALSILGTQGVCERAVGAFIFTVSAWSGEGGLDTQASVVLGHLCEVACAVLLCRSALIHAQRWWLILLVAIFIALVACWQAALAPERTSALFAKAAGSSADLAFVLASAYGSAAARVFARHLLGSALCELSWLYMFVRGALSVVGQCAVAGALSGPTAAGAESVIAGAGWLLATVLLVRRYTRALSQLLVRGPVTAALAMAEKSAAVLAAQTICGASLHHPLMLPVFWVLDADSAHGVLWRDCGAGGSFLGVFAPNILAAAGLWDESIVPDVAESDVDEDSDYALAKRPARPAPHSPRGGEAGHKAKQLTYSQQLRLCAGLGCPLMWARARWVASVCVAGLLCAAAVALWQLLAAVSGLSVAHSRAGAALLPPHCFAKLDPVACVVAAVSHGFDEGVGSVLSAASHCFTPAAGLADASVVQSGTALVVDAAAAVFVAIGAIAAAAATALTAFGLAPAAAAGAGTHRTLAALGMAGRHAAPELLSASAATPRAHSLAPHEAQLLYGFAPLPLLKAALLCSGALLVAGRAFPRGLLRAVSWCSRQKSDRSASATTSPAPAAAAAASTDPGEPPKEHAAPPPSLPWLVKAWCGAVRVAAFAAVVLAGATSIQVALPPALIATWTADVPLLSGLDVAALQIFAAAVLMSAVALMQILPPPPASTVERAQLRGAAIAARAAAGACLLALCVAVFPLALSVVSVANAAGDCSSTDSINASCGSGLRTLTVCMVSRDDTAQWLNGSAAGPNGDAAPVLATPLVAQSIFLCVAVLGWLWQERWLEDASAAWPRWRRRRTAAAGKPATVWTRKNICRIVPRPPRAVLAARAARASAAALAAPAVTAAMHAAVAAVVSSAASSGSEAGAGSKQQPRNSDTFPDTAPRQRLGEMEPRHTPRLRMRQARAEHTPAVRASRDVSAPSPVLPSRRQVAATAAQSPRPRSSPSPAALRTTEGEGSPPQLVASRSPRSLHRSPRGVVKSAVDSEGDGDGDGGGFHMQLRPRNTSAPPTPTFAGSNGAADKSAFAPTESVRQVIRGEGAVRVQAAPAPAGGRGAQPSRGVNFRRVAAVPPTAADSGVPLLPTRMSRAAQSFVRSRRLRSAAAVLSKAVPVARSLLGAKALDDGLVTAIQRALKG